MSTRTVYTVTELNGSARLALSTHFGNIWVEGELSNLSQPSSGHLYFSLKDAECQVRCAMFRGSARGLGFRPEVGLQVLVKAQVSLYEPRGDFQLIVEFMEESGDGALRRAFEAMKLRLAVDGLFDQERKKPIPVLPHRVGVITSPSGAALRDILSVLQRRFPALPVLVFPVPVQGADAKVKISEAIALADRLKLCDVLILARGGGSLEDLWAFNEEQVARAIAACGTPIIAGIGHETDVTIADLVADLRAPTPSAAAESASPDCTEWLERFARLEIRFGSQLRSSVRQYSQNLRFLNVRLHQVHPLRQLQRHAQRLDELELRLKHLAAALCQLRKARVQTLQAKLYRHSPQNQIGLWAAYYRELSRRLVGQGADLTGMARQRFAKVVVKLDAISPLATLDRGYSITTRTADGAIVRTSCDVREGDLIETRVAEGRLLSRVEPLG